MDLDKLKENIKNGDLDIDEVNSQLVQFGFLINTFSRGFLCWIMCASSNCAGSSCSGNTCSHGCSGLECAQGCAPNCASSSCAIASCTNASTNA